MTKHADFKRRVRERMAKTGESYAAARGQLLATQTTATALDGGMAEDRMAQALHVSNGDSTDLPGTGLARHVLYWRDVLHEGPVPAADPEALRQIRAAFLVQAHADDRSESGAMFAARDRTLEAHRNGEYVLWFEADLYDQLQIIQILTRLGGLGVPAERVTLICIGEHPGIGRFGGLGELSAEQLRDLAGTNARAVLSPAAFQLAATAWAAFQAPAPTGYGAIVATRSGELRFLAEAFDRLGREYPSTRDGLSLTERRILASVADGAPDAATAFMRASARETRPYLGDTWCFAMIDRMKDAPVPLLTAEPAGEPVMRHTRLRPAAAGLQVLAGDADHVELNGIDKWIGGVHLTGRQVQWRWDEATEALTEQT